MSKITAGTQTAVTVTKLKHHPINPRRGDVDAIAESLKYHGQYRPVVVQKSTNFILAGNHTVKAAKKLGWKTVNVTYVDCDDQTALKILLADNRLNDLSDYDHLSLKALLETLPELDGSGFSPNDLQELDDIINEPFEPTTPTPTRPDPSREPEVKIGAYKFAIYPIAYEAWNDQLQEETDRNRDKARETIKTRLQIPKPTPIAKNPAKPEIAPQVETQIEPITAVRPHPDNPRQGDIGAITQSLQEFGQYRPIVANKTTGRILVGNHTYQGAVLLGWKEIAVSWVEVDEDSEIKILLVDNRTSDLATYDKTDHQQAVTQVLGNLNGTGYTLEDVDDIQAGSSTKQKPVGKVTISVGKYTMRINKEQLDQFSQTITHWTDIAERLLMPIDACHPISKSPTNFNLDVESENG